MKGHSIIWICEGNIDNGGLRLTESQSLLKMIALICNIMMFTEIVKTYKLRAKWLILNSNKTLHVFKF